MFCCLQCSSLYLCMLLMLSKQKKRCLIIGSAYLFSQMTKQTGQVSLPAWKLNTAPSLIPDGQRAVTVFSLV